MKTQLSGLEDESFALSWNRHQKGLLCSAAQKMIAVWDTEKSSQPSILFENAHVEAVNDVKFSPHEAHGGNLLISTSDDGHFKIWDVRKPTTEFVMAYKDSEDSLCIGQFNPIN